MFQSYVVEKLTNGFKRWCRESAVKDDFESEHANESTATVESVVSEDESESDVDMGSTALPNTNLSDGEHEADEPSEEGRNKHAVVQKVMAATKSIQDGRSREISPPASQVQKRGRSTSKRRISDESSKARRNNTDDRTKRATKHPEPKAKKHKSSVNVACAPLQSTFTHTFYFILH